MDLSLSLIAQTLTRGRTGIPPSGPVPAPTPDPATPLAPLAGILDAPHVVVLGASILEGGMETAGTVKPEVAAYAAAAGFTGTIHSYATGGTKVGGAGGAIDQHAQSKVDIPPAASQMLYVVHSGGNNISGARPYPGGADLFEADYTTLMQNIAAGGDRVIPLPLTKRLYGIGDAGYPNNPKDVVQGVPESEKYGSKPYNLAIIHPAIAENAPDWIETDGMPFVDPYAMINADPEMLGPDGVHGPGIALVRYILARIAARARGERASDSRSGRSYLFSPEKGNPNSMALGLVNVVPGYPDGATNYPVFDGALDTAGRFDGFLKVRHGAFTNGTSGMDSTGYPRLADTRFHDLAVVGNGIYVQGTQRYEMRIEGLVPGERVRVSCCGVRSAGGTGRRATVDLTGGQARELDASNVASSNQVVFDEIAAPADGRLILGVQVAPGSTYGYLHGVLIDFP